jgi:hypothetical protein
MMPDGILTKQVITVPFRSGLDTKDDPFQIREGTYLTLENGIFQTPLEIRKRWGYQALSNTISNPPAGHSSTITTGNALMTYNNELVLCDVNSLYSYSPDAEEWVYKGALSSTAVTTKNIYRSTYSQSAADGNVAPNGLRCYAFIDSHLGLCYTVIDSTTQTVVQPITVIHASGIQPKVLILGNQFLILYVRSDTKNLYVGTLSIPSPNSGVTSTAITSTSGATKFKLGWNSGGPPFSYYDACVMNGGTNLYVAFGNGVAGGGAGITTYQFTTHTGFSATPTNNAVYAGTSSTTLAIFPDWSGPANPSGGPVLLWSSELNLSVANVYMAAYDNTLTNVLIAQYILTTSAAFTAFNQMTGVSIGTTSRNLMVFASDGTWSGNSSQTYTYAINVTGSGYTAATPVLIAPMVVVASKAFNYEGTAYFYAAYGSNLQSQYLLLDQNGNVVAKGLQNAGWGATPGLYGPWPEVPAVSATAFTLAGTVVDLIGTLPVSTGPTGSQPALTTAPILTQTYTQTGVGSVDVDYADSLYSYSRATLGGVLLIGGGLVHAYDGIGITELGFLVYPELASNACTVTNSGGSIAAGTPYYVAVYQWVDAQGNTHYSTPSVPVSCTTTGSSQVSIRIPILPLTAKQAANARSPVTIMVYRNQVSTAGINFTAAISTNVPAVDSGSGVTNAPIVNPTITNDSQNLYVTFIDKLADSAILGNQPLYTTGNVLVNSAPNPTSVMTVNFNRVFALDSTNPLSIWFTEQCLPGTPPTFSNWLTEAVDPRNGDITCIYAMDSATVIFKETAMFAITGQGPDNTGNQWSFSAAQYISVDAGCQNPKSIVYTGAGLFFQAVKNNGIYLLHRDFQTLTYVGAPVEALMQGANVTSAQLLPNVSAVRFTLDSGIALHFDYNLNAWSVHRPINAVDSAIYSGNFAYLSPAGTVFVETPNQFSDNGQYISMNIQTGWITAAGLQGAQRIFNVAILGKLINSHILQWGLAYDYSPVATQTGSITVPSNPSPYGQDTYGADSPFGGVSYPYQWEIRPNQQRSESVQLSLMDVQFPGGNVGESLSLSALAFEVGIMKGIRRMPSTNIVT